MNRKIYVDIHVLQTVAPSNLNRDDQGQPKSCIYGGVQRARVSSQAWKRQIRQYFREHLDPQKVGIRTKHYAELTTEKILELSPGIESEQALKMAKNILKNIGLKMDKNGSGEVLVFFAPDQIGLLASKAIELGTASLNSAEKKAFIKDLSGGITADIALFGRMVASEPAFNIEASSQVAHAISTHEVFPDYDYFTAVDDFPGEDQQGSAHLGDSPFNSATLYRYANIDASALVSQIGEEPALEAIRLFLEGFILTIPSGKQNSFSAHNLPYFVEVSVHSGLPISYAGAFEKAVNPDEGFEKASLKKYREFKKNLLTMYGKSEESFESCLFDPDSLTISELIDKTLQEVREDIEKK